MRVTMRMIAEKAGVSRGTVDKVLHNRGGISPDVDKKVRKIAKEMGYNPNKAAKALISLQNPSTIAVIIPNTTNPFFFSMKAGMDRAVQDLRDYGLNVEYYYSDSVDVDAIISTLQYLESKVIHGLAIRGVQSEALKEKVQSFADNGVPVLTYDSDLDGVDRICFVGEDNLRSGRIAAKLLGKIIGGKGEVAILTGSTSVQAHARRVQGFREAMAECFPDIQIVDELLNLEQNVIAYDNTNKLLAEHPALMGIFNAAGCTDMVAKAVVDNDKKGIVKLVTYNFTPDVIQYVKNGTIDFTIGLTPFEQGRRAIRTLFNYMFFDEKPETPYLKTPLYIGMDENISMFDMGE